MKKKILIIGTALDCGGVQKALLSLINGLDREKYQVYLLLTRREGEWIQFVRDDVIWVDTPSFFQWINIPRKHFFLSCRLLINKPVFLINYFLAIFQGLLIRNMGKSRQYFWDRCMPDIPNLKGTFDVALDFSGHSLGYTIEKVDAIRKGTWIHSDYRVYKKDMRYDYKYFQKYDFIACVSETCQDIFNDIYPSISSKTCVINNIIDADEIDRLSLQGESYNDGFTGFRILDVTRIDPNKGLEIAIEACLKLKNDNVPVRWYIIGEGSYKKVLLNLIRVNSLENEFIFLGQLINPYPYMKDADIIVHCSYFEGRSVSIDESLVLGKKVLLTDYPTAKDQILHNINGRIVPFISDSIKNEIISMLNTDKMKFLEGLKITKEEIVSKGLAIYKYI